MLARMAFSAVLLLALGRAPVFADQHEKADDWIRFFVGNWERTSTTQLDNEESEQTSLWSCKLVAGDTATVATGKTSEGDEWVDLFGWNGHSKSLHEFGKMSTGDNWIINFEIVDSNNLRGEAVGGLPDGRSGKGFCTIQRTGKDSYKAVFELTLSDGSKFRVSDQNKRKD